MQGIYQILNLENGKSYIGSSKNIERRFNYYHKRLLVNDKHWNRHLQSAWNIYGEENFTLIVLEEVLYETDLLTSEKHWVDKYSTMNRGYGYNIASPDRTIVSAETREKMRINGLLRGAPNPKGWHHTDEAKQKIAIAGKKRTGIKLSSETKSKIGDFTRGKSYETLYGINKALEIKQKQKDAHARGCYEQSRLSKIGKKQSEETIAKRSAAMIGKPQSEEKRRKCGEVRRKYIPDNDKSNILALYSRSVSLSQISRETQYSIYMIKKCLAEYGTKEVDS